VQLGRDVLKAGQGCTQTNVRRNDAVILRLTSQPLVIVISSGEFSSDMNLGRQWVDCRLRLPHVYAIRSPSEVLQLDAAFDGTEWPSTLPGPDYFDEEAKCYSRLFEFCQVTFCRSRQWGCVTLAKF